MNTRTMRREVYLSHEDMRRSQLKKRCIYRCRMAMIEKLKNAALSVIIFSLVMATAISAVAAGTDNSDIIAQAKTPAHMVEASTTNMILDANTLSNPILLDSVPVIDNLKFIIDEEDDLALSNQINDEEIEAELQSFSVQYSDNANEPAETAAQEITTPEPTVVIEELVVEETTEPVAEVASYTYDSSKPTSLDNPYKCDCGYVYTDEDYEYLLKIIVGEAQNCSYEHQMYVGSVVLNRLHNDKYFSYADCIKDVALAKGQYACFSDGNANKTPTDLNKLVARELLENGSVLPSNVIFQAQFKQGSGTYIQLGNTYFCWKD